ncbi:MAG: GAF domain-containing protein [Deltaproteobacteria bacterium]|nr:GAF domain-containing protein [Deltaproteobacteria bacterium]
MPLFEVFIPAKDANSMNVTLRLDAENWIGALRTGLSNIGEGHDAISNVMCDVKEDNSIHVTNPTSGRVFRLHEIKAEAPAAPAPAAASGPAEEAPEPIDESKTPPTPGPAKIAAEAISPPPAAQPASAAKAIAPPPKRTTGQFNEEGLSAERAESKPNQTDPHINAALPKDNIDVNDAIADVFDATQDLMMEPDVAPQKVADVLLDIAMKIVKAESGTFYIADVNNHELAFTAVRGPKAAELKKKKFSVPVGQGIVGFCAQEGVCLAIQDMQLDERYFSAISDAIGYVPKNTVCATAEKEGRLFGAIQLINSPNQGFSAAEMEVLRYIGLCGADILERTSDRHTQIGL